MDTKVTPRVSVSEGREALQSFFFLIGCSTKTPFSTVQTHCRAVLNFREWHLSSKSWSTRLLPKITTVQGYFSYNSSGCWLSLLLMSCSHISIHQGIAAAHSEPGHPQNPSCRALWAESCVFISWRKPTFDLYLLHSSPFLSLLKFWLALGCFYKTIFFFSNFSMTVYP